MIVRLGLLVAASLAAFKLQKLNVNSPKSEHGEARIKKHQDEGTEQKHVTCSNNGHNQKEREEEEQKEEVKLISSIVNPANDFEDNILSEFEGLLSGETDFLLLADKTGGAKKDGVRETEMSTDASELERLRNLVKELEEREVKIEGELLEYYGLKEQESDIEELQRQLKNKIVEIDMLNMTIDSLKAENNKLQEELLHAASAKRELEVTRSKIKEMQRKIQLEANRAKGQLLLLKQKVSGLQAREEEAIKKDAETEKKLKTVNDLEIEVVGLKRTNNELQHEKRELTVKLNAAQSRITELSSMTENEMVAKEKVELGRLRRANEDLQKQVEGLQMNRFSEVDELVYLRWVNACLRFELKSYHASPGKLSASDLNNNLSPKSQEKAKQLMLEYARSVCGQGDTVLESNFSHSSSPGSEDFDNASINSSINKFSNLSKKTGLIQKLKKWNKNKDDSSALSSPDISLSGGSPGRMSMSNRQRSTLESLMLRNASDAVAITTFGQKDQELTETPSLPSISSVSSSDSLNSVANSFQLMSKSVDRSLDETYPAYKDRHKLALAREKQIKEQADIARVQKFDDNSTLNMTKAEEEKPISLPPKLTQVREKAHVSVSFDDQSDNGKNFNDQTISKVKLVHIEKRPPRVPQPPPKPSDCACVGINSNSSKGVPYALSVPSPPPPPPLLGGPSSRIPTPGILPRGIVSDDKVQWDPELVELYQSLMKREAKKDTLFLNSSTTDAPDARTNLIGEVENRSSFLLAVKADVETQGDLVMSLANEVRVASFSKIEDLVAFVNWLDEELSFLVDKRAVLKHFDWPEGKANTLREAVFEYQDLMGLERQVSTFIDDPKLPCEVALLKMYTLLEKVEQSLYALLRTRDLTISRYMEFGVPINWLLDSGIVGKIKLSSIQLAKKYMKRVASELDILSGPEKEPIREFLILQGMRFSFRVHQFAGGFDTESMKAFEELRNRIHAQAGEDNKPET